MMVTTLKIISHKTHLYKETPFASFIFVPLEARELVFAASELTLFRIYQCCKCLSPLSRPNITHPGFLLVPGPASAGLIILPLMLKTNNAEEKMMQMMQ